jgi:hypothetical protein
VGKPATDGCKGISCAWVCVTVAVTAIACASARSQSRTVARVHGRLPLWSLNTRAIQQRSPPEADPLAVSTNTNVQ